MQKKPELLKKISQEIASQYIKTIVLLDDEAFQPKTTTPIPNDEQPCVDSNVTDYSIDIKEISSEFLKDNKIFAAYNPKKESDIGDFKKAAERADVVILDWNINVKQDKQTDPNADADIDDPRGSFTIELIKELINSNVRLIIVYTGETGIKALISEQILKEVKDLERCEDVDLLTKEHDTKILVRAKPQSTSTEDSKYRIEYKGLPNLIKEEYAKMTEGILPNFALMALSRIDHLSKSILKTFSRESDIGYLSHKMLIPYIDDAEDLLLSIFGESIASALEDSGINEDFRKKVINSWLKDFKGGECSIRKNIKCPNKDATRCPVNNLNVNVTNNITTLFDRNTNDIKNRIKNLGFSNKDYKAIEKNLHELVLLLDNNAHASCCLFSKITQHKIQYGLNEHILTLGTVLKNKIKDKEEYYVCIQPRCDSVRIKKNQEKDFVFLKLAKSDSGIPIILPDDTELRCQKSFDLKIYTFKQTNNTGVIKTSKEGEKYVYKTITGEKLEWIVQIKDMHAQHIADAYSASLSRVGINNSEWFRLKTSI